MSKINLQGTLLTDVFDALQRTFQSCKVDFYLIGALAKDAWYPEGKSPRITKDLDLAVLVNSEAVYQLIKDHLVDNENFNIVSSSDYVLVSPQGIEVDILPFGAIAVVQDDIVTIEGLANINVAGFNEVYQTGVAQIKMPTGHNFKVATLPAIILLKILAYNDRPEERQKDPRDIAQIIQIYFEVQQNIVYSYGDLFTNKVYSDLELEDLAAITIGREIGKIASGNAALTGQLHRILHAHLTAGVNSNFITHMAREAGVNLEIAISWLNWLYTGLHEE